MSELLNHLRSARSEFAEDAISAYLEKLGFVGLRPEARKTAEAAVSATLEEIEAFLRANAQGPTGEAEKSLADPKAEAIATAAAKVFATLDAIKAHIRASTTEAPEPSAAPQEGPTLSTSEKALVEKAMRRLNAAEQASQEQDEQVPPPQDEQVPPPQDERPLPNFAGIFAQGRFDAEQPAVCPQLLLAFGLLMRHVGEPYKRSKPNQLQRAIQHVGRHIARGNGISEIELFNQAHRADIEARRNRPEAKIARDSKPRKPTK